MGDIYRRIVGFGALVIFLGGLPGCMFRELSKNQRAVDRTVQVGVKVEGERFGDHPVYAALVDDPADGDLMAVTVETYGVVPERGTLTLRAESGEYLLVAFQDLNDNQHYDDAEPFAVYGEPTPIDLWPGRVIEELPLSLSVSVMPDMWTPSQLQERGVELSKRLEQFGAVVTLDDPRFAREVARTGMWRPAEFIRGNNASLYKLEPYDPAKTPIVFVHGIGGTPRHFTDIIASLDRERFQPWVFYYPSALRLQDLGDYLQVTLERLRGFHRFNEVVVVSHSMGGLVAWAGVKAHLEQTSKPYIGMLVTIHSPLGGMASAATGVDRAPVVMKSWIDLDPRSDFVATIYETDLPRSLAYHLFFGVGEEQDLPLPLPLKGLEAYLETLDAEALTDETVTLDSQLHRPAVARANAIHGHPGTHMGTLSSPDMLATLNRLLADYADDSSGLSID